MDGATCGLLPCSKETSPRSLPRSVLQGAFSKERLQGAYLQGVLQGASSKELPPRSHSPRSSPRSVPKELSPGSYTKERPPRSSLQGAFLQGASSKEPSSKELLQGASSKEQSSTETFPRSFLRGVLQGASSKEPTPRNVGGPWPTAAAAPQLAGAPAPPDVQGAPRPWVSTAAPCRLCSPLGAPDRSRCRGSQAQASWRYLHACGRNGSKFPPLRPTERQQ